MTATLPVFLKTSEMFEILKNYKKEISGFLNEFFYDKKTEFTKINQWGPDVISKFSDFFKNGHWCPRLPQFIANDIKLCGNRCRQEYCET